MKSKSAIMSEVSLGSFNQLMAADYDADNMPRGKHSVQGMRRVGPAGFKKMVEGVEIHLGPPRDTKVVNKKGFKLDYDEFIVYDIKQIKMKDLAKIKINYKF